MPKAQRALLVPTPPCASLLHGPLAAPARQQPCLALRPDPSCVPTPCSFCPHPSSARSPLPKPVGDDFQCAVAATPHTLLAVGGVERAGLLAKQRGIWQYNAHEGTWTRAG